MLDFEDYVCSADGANCDTISVYVAEAIEIELGPKTGNDVVVSTGLKGGETIIVEGLQKVRPGMQVDPQPTGSTAS